MALGASVLQLLHRIVYGRPKAPIHPPLGGRRVAPWATKAGEPSTDVAPLQILRRSHDLQKVYAEATRVSYERETRYKDYEDMILDSVIAGAIELMVDDSMQFSRDQKATVWVTSEDNAVREALEELFDRIQVEERLFDWGFNTAAYGDFFIRPIGIPGLGIVRVEDDWHPADVQRIDVNGALVGFRTTRTAFQNIASGEFLDIWDPWEWVHFKIQASQRRRREVERERMAPSSRYEKRKYRFTTRYGVSTVEAVRRTYKQLQMVEQSLIIARLTRALLRYIYKIHVGSQATPKESVALMNQMKELLTQTTGYKLGEGWEQQYDPPGGAEDIFIPVFGERGDVTIDTLGGDVDIKGIVDIDYLRNKLFAGLRTPKAFLGFEENLPGSLGESALLRLDIRYARTVKRLQRAMIQGLTRLAQIHLAYKKLPVDPSKFSVEMDVVSTAEEEERKSALSSALAVGGDVSRLVTDMGLMLPKKEFAKLIFSEILGLGGKFITLLDKATEAPVEGMPPPEGIGAVPGEGPLPPPGEVAPEAEISPEELIAPEEAPPPEGVLPTPGESVRSSGRGVLYDDAKKVAREGVQRQVKQSLDIKAETPRVSGEKVERSIIRRRLKRDKSFAAVIESAISFERATKEEEKERQKESKKKVMSAFRTFEDTVKTEGG